MATAKVQDTQRPPSAVAQEHLHAYSVQYPGHPLLIVHVFNCQNYHFPDCKNCTASSKCGKLNGGRAKGKLLPNRTIEL